jgi:predicted ATPase/DNA-binding winged helix-turn-helix (wHTH) protein
MVRFGDVEVDVPGRELRRSGRQVHLEPQAFDLLATLIEHRDRVLSKTELFDGVWGHRFVSEANLTTRIKEIRRAVGDDGARQHTIRNVRGRGYRFVAEVEAEASGRSGRTRVAGRLIGRDAEIAAVVETLACSPVVTLTGPVGVGKSTLARAVAERTGLSYADGVRVVELSALDGGEHALPAVARALDVVLDSDRPERAVRSIAELDVLLVLDNCEHVIDDVGSLLDQLMGTGGARVSVLATSQVRLGLSVEHVVGVHPLSPEHALELFALRAKATCPSLDLGGVGRDRVATLLAGLDQLPLTIEMAAARLGSMTFDELERAVVVGAPMPVTHRSSVRRHRSLDSLVAWSAELLDPSLRSTFTEFAVFAGSVTAADAAAVIGVGRPMVIFDLAALAERSLLVADIAGPATRYRMLTTVRAVAARWLEESGTAQEVRRRHAEHFTAATKMIDSQIRTPSEADGRRRLDAIAAEVRAAHRWARGNQAPLAAEMSGALHLAAYSTFWNEPAEWSRILLAQHLDFDSDTLLGARIVVAGADANRSQLLAARIAATALSTERDPRVQAAAWEILADVAIYDGHLSEVAAITAELRRLGEELDDPHSITTAGVDAALALAFANDADGALAILSPIDLEAIAPSDRAWVMYARGEALSTAGDPTATSAYTAAIEMARAVGNPFVASVARASLASEHARAGDVHNALDEYAVCLHEYARHGNFVHAVTTLRNLIEVLIAIGDDRGATILAAATSGDHLRPSYGVETTRLSAHLAAVEQRVGAAHFATWTGEGQLLDVPQAVQVAVDLIDGHRSLILRQSSGSPPTTETCS